MNPHPRICKTIKWGGAAVTALLVVMWIGSEWEGVQWVSGTRSAFFVKGCLVISGWTGQHEGFSMPPQDLPNGWYMAPAPNGHPRIWWPDSSRNLVSRTVRTPVWPVIGTSIAATGIATYLDIRARRARLNLCSKCNYDRTGIAPTAPCPECGTTPPSSPSA